MKGTSPTKVINILIFYTLDYCLIVAIILIGF